MNQRIVISITKYKLKLRSNYSIGEVLAGDLYYLLKSKISINISYTTLYKLLGALGDFVTGHNCMEKKMIFTVIY